MILLVESALKVALILLLALVVMPLLRNRAAALRHWVLAATLICAAAAPIAGAAMPSWRLPIALTTAAPETTRPDGVWAPPSSNTSVVSQRQPIDRGGFPLATALGAIWIAGTVAGMAVLVVGLVRLARLASGARRISDDVWADCAEEIRREYGIRRPVTLLQSVHPSLLVTWGVLEPKVLLPAGAQLWGGDRVRLVLSHELAHIRRRDWCVQLAAEVLRCIYWFNPLVWIACRRLRQESEQACDDVVLNRGIEGSHYATHFVNIARELQHRRTWVPAPSIARTSSLERRVKAMLDARLNRRPVSGSAIAATLAALLTVTIPIAGVAVAQSVFATVAGSIVDPTNGALPGVTLVLTNAQSQAKYEVRSDRTGRYEFVGLAAGDYLLEAKLTGFAVLRGTLTVAGQNVQQDLKLEVGSLSETITVRASASRPDSNASLRLGSDNQRLKPRDAPKCGNASSQDGTPIGGNIRPPHKLYDVRPHYPASALRAGVEGPVVLQGRIGTDGSLEDLKIVSTPHADLASAAMDAVHQWQFDATYLNCVAVPVNIGITVNFERER